jgi:hypothetical protein
MATKTERILGYLPGTFLAVADPSALRAVAGAAGDELQRAENSLAAVMRAHWVDHADRGAPAIDDLARLAALYGLAPRTDGEAEGVEAFREHLERYVRTFLDGTVTVAGILRVTAEALGLILDDAPLDAWWLPGNEVRVDPTPGGTPPRRFVTRATLADEAARTLLGFVSGEAAGAAATPAVLAGRRDLSRGVDLSGGGRLRLVVDGGPVVVADCAGARPRTTLLAEIRGAIDGAVRAAVPGSPGSPPGAAVTADDDGFLILVSPTVGPASRIVLVPPAPGEADVRRTLFGDAPDVAAGSAAQPATLTGGADLLSPVDLSERSWLRLAVDAVDGGAPFEVQVAGAAPDKTFLDEVVAALNARLPGLAAATADDRLRLTSPTTGEASRIAVLPRRYLELQEYPPEPAAAHFTVRHGAPLTILERGAADAIAEVEIRPLEGAFAPGLASLAGGWEVRVLAALARGEAVRLRVDAGGQVRAALVAADGTATALPDAAVQVGPLAAGLALAALYLPRGRSRWLYLDGGGSRFDAAAFDAARFAGLPSTAPGVFDVSRFHPAPGPLAVVAPVFAGPGDPAAATTAAVTVRWRSHRPGAFVVNLPADLPARFGGRFDAARFGAATPETFPDVVLGPAGDPRGLEQAALGSSLVTVSRAGRAPIGFTVAAPPFRAPLPLTLGDDQQPASLYLAEAGMSDVLAIQARAPGAWGNGIAVSARPAGPGSWEVAVHFPGARCENARQAALGRPLAALARDLLAAGPVGILEAKAAGVRARVTRDRAELPVPNPES